MSIRYRFLFLVLVTLLIALLTGSLWASPPDALVAQLEKQSDGKVVVHLDDVTGVARYVHAEEGALTREFANLKADPEAAARAFLATYGGLFGLTDQATQLQLKSVKQDELGMQHVRFTQQHEGLPVFGADLIVHLGADGAVLSANGFIVADAVALDTQAKLGAEQASEIARGQLAFTGDASVSEQSLVIFKPGLITDEPSATYLTYRLRVTSASQPDLARWLFVDAQSGEVRFDYPAVTDGRNRRTYNMKHRTNYNRATLARTEGQGPVSSATNCTAADVNNAHDYAGHTYDFYFSRFGRDSYNNAGATLYSYVCYGNNYQNAFWDGSRMTYGDGFASADDVVAHELSHGVTEYASGLIYSYQSGALNESYSDIFGEAVDLTNSGGTDTAAVRWDMGEDIPGFGAIRDMMDPTRFGDPDRTNSSYYYCGSGDNGGVHTNSGVPNKAFALMVDGGTFNGHTITAIGMDAAVQIQYRTNEYYLSSSSKFLDNYNYLLQSCGDLYGASSSTCTEVRDALEAVKMNGAICGSGGATPTPGSGPTPTPPPSGGSIVNGNFESGRNVGWSESSSHGWAIVGTYSPYQGSYAAWLGGGNSETSTLSQNIGVPSGGATLYYRYKISSSDWCGYDYGYVKLNGSTAQTYSLCSSNNTSGYALGSVSLSGYAGQTVTLEFRATTDSSYSSSFYIDNVGYSSSLTEGEGLTSDHGSVKPEKKQDRPAGTSEEKGDADLAR